MLKKALIVFCWFQLTLALVVLNLSLLMSLNNKVNAREQVRRIPPQITASSFGTEQVLGASVIAADARALLLAQFLQQHASPLAPHAEYIVARAEQYGLDYRLLPAIAMCESNVGKRMPSSDSYNEWGISVETGELSGAKFPNWLYAIDWVSRYMKEKYYDRGISTITDIGAIYAQPSVENGNSWASCVEHFMEEIQ